MSKNGHQGPSWDDLRFLLVLARSGSVQGASRTLGASRSTVVRRLHALEAALGAKLADRSRRGVGMTPAGEALVAAAERMENEAVAAQRILMGKGSMLSGRLEFTTFDVGARLLAPVLATYARLHPQVQLFVSTSNEPYQLERREADLAVRLTHRPSNGLFGRRLGRFEFGIFGTPEMIDHPDPPWLLPDERLGAERSWTLARRLATEFRVAARYLRSDGLLPLLHDGLGVTFLPLQIGRREPLAERAGEWPEMGYDVWALTHHDLRNTSRVRALLRLLGERGPAVLAIPERRA
ncbi:MAG: LysR family transcriptional regulator [Myxococcota bacterium]